MKFTVSFVLTLIAIVGSMFFQANQVNADPSDPWQSHQFKCTFEVHGGLWAEKGCNDGLDPQTWEQHWDHCNASAGVEFDGELTDDYMPWEGNGWYSVYCYSGNPDAIPVPPVITNPSEPEVPVDNDPVTPDVVIKNLVVTKFEIPQPREAKYNVIEQVPNNLVGWIEYWDGGDIVYAQRMDVNTVYFFRIIDAVVKDGKVVSGAIEGDHFAYSDKDGFKQ